MRNSGIMPVFYEWKFADEDQISSNPQGDDIRINEVFDILPLNGLLNPGQIETVEFIYNAF